MNKTEARYALYLEGLKRSGVILWYGYESIKLRLAQNTFYTPDFLVMLSDGYIEFHEVKGFWEDKARVKIKVAANTYPFFRFTAIQLKSGLWVREEF